MLRTWCHNWAVQVIGHACEPHAQVQLPEVALLLVAARVEGVQPQRALQRGGDQARAAAREELQLRQVQLSLWMKWQWQGERSEVAVKRKGDPQIDFACTAAWGTLSLPPAP